MEEEEHLSLRWAEHTLTFVHLLNQYREQKLYCDASLACGGGGVYPVHKVVLSACSDFCASIFASTTCRNPVVVLQDVTKEQLQVLLTYVYQGEVLMARSDLPTFLKVAENLQIKGLTAHHKETSDKEFNPIAKYLDDPIPASPKYDNGGVDRLRGKRISQRDEDCNGQSPITDFNPIAKYPDDPNPTIPKYDNEGLNRQRGKKIIQKEEDCSSYSPPNTESIHITKYPDKPNPTSPKLDEGGLDRQWRKRISEEEDVCSHRPPRKRFPARTSTPPSVERAGPGGGGVQTLVALEEREIKEEPSDERLTVCDAEDQRIEEETKKERDGENEMTEERKEKMMEEEKNEGGKEEDVKVMLNSEHQDQLTPQSMHTHVSSSTTTTTITIASPQLIPSIPTKSPTPAHQPCSPSQPHALSPTPAHPAHTPTPATPVKTSQLRRELLKPLQYRAIPNSPPGNPQLQGDPYSLVLSPHEENGEVEVVLRDPPPLFKIPSPSSPSLSLPIGPPSPLSTSPPLHPHHLPHHHFRYHHHHHHHHHPLHLSRQMDERDETTTPITSPATSPNKGHSLVTTPPPYNMTRYPATRPHLTHHYNYQPYPDFKDIDMDTDGPLNLSQDTNGRRSRVNAARQEHERGGGVTAGEGDPFLGKILTNRKRRLRGPKSWEYLVRLLHDPSTNPSLIRWENEANGVFRLVEPAAIAQRWGRRTGKHASEGLTYENFARGLRYHYATGALEPVSERSFVYKFGPRAVTTLGEAKGGGGGEDCALIPNSNEMQPAITHV